MLRNLTIEEFVQQTASGAPTPGGGSVAALVGSIGAALNVMVYNLTEDKKVYREFEPALRDEVDQAAKKLTKLYDELLVEMQNDTTAFDKVMDAFKLPKETEEEKAKRSEAIQEGYKVAMEVPLKTANLCLEALFLMEVLSIHGSLHAISDVGVGCLLAYAGVEGSLLNVRINLNSMKSNDYTDEIKEKMEKILNIAKDTRSIVMNNVYGRLED